MSHTLRSLALCGVLAVAAPFATQAASDEPQQYHLTDTLSGSVLPQPIMNASLPFDSTYAALTTEQKEVLFDSYERLAPGDEPPYPLYGVRHLIKPLISYAEITQLAGTLEATVDVDAKGDAVSVTVYKSPDYQTARIVSGAMALEKYKPAMCEGQPCNMKYVLQLDFPGKQGLPLQEIAFKHYNNRGNFGQQ
jgi:hypothetical protein